MSKSYGKTGVAPILQLGKFGPQWQGVLPAGVIQALAPPGTGGFARVQGADSVDEDDFVTRRQLLASAVTEPATDTALINPSAYPIAVALGDRAIATDFGPGPTIELDLAAMTAADADKGRRVSLILSLGNPNRAVQIDAAAGQGLVDPLAAGAAQPSLFYPAGTFSGYTDLTFEAVPGALSYPATIIPPIVPDNVPFVPNFGTVGITINGTGGTLPSLANTLVSLQGQGDAGDISLTVNTASQPGGPGTAWTITATIPASALSATPQLYNVVVFDASAFPATTTFARLEGGFGGGVTASPSQPITDIWIPDESAPSVGSRWDESLAAGPNTNGNSAYVSLEDQVVWTSAAPPLADPTQPPQAGGFGQPDPNFHPKASRSGTVPSGAGYVNLGSAIHTFTGLTAGGPGNTIWLRWVGQYKQATTGPVRLAVLEEIWAYEFGVWSRLETITASNWSNRFRFEPSGASIFVQAIQDAANNYNARGVCEWSWTDGFPAA